MLSNIAPDIQIWTKEKEEKNEKNNHDAETGFYNIR